MKKGVEYGMNSALAVGNSALAVGEKTIAMMTMKNDIKYGDQEYSLSLRTTRNLMPLNYMVHIAFFICFFNKHSSSIHLKT